MLSCVTLKRYIKKCDEVIEAHDALAAKALQKEIIAVLEPSLRGLTRGLTNYSSIGAFTDRYGKTIVVGDNLDYIKDLHTLRSRLQVELEQMEESASADMSNTKREHKLFISHASKDREFILALIELFEGIGMREGSIVCSSIPGYGIPSGAQIYDWLREQFLLCDLRVLFVLSQNYYKSAACLNEMGAAWVTRASDTLILLPGFTFSDIRGCIDSRKIGICFDCEDDELRHRLNELKETLTKEHALIDVTQIRWERYRDSFINKIRKISEKAQTKDVDKMESSENEYRPIVGVECSDHIPLEPSFLLVYAAEADGRIFRKVGALGTPPMVSVSGKVFMHENSNREAAKWQEALDWLVKMGWVKLADKSGQVFTLTGTGFMKADELKEGMNIDTSREPIEELKEFE